jgi:hypothetical protein
MRAIHAACRVQNDLPAKANRSGIRLILRLDGLD